MIWMSCPEPNQQRQSTERKARHRTCDNFGYDNCTTLFLFCCRCTEEIVLSVCFIC